MFTGIVEELGEIKCIQKGTSAIKITIKAQKVLEGTKVGDSICTNGVCLTVTRLENDGFQVDVMPETVRKSNLQQLKVGSNVHLERAATLQTRLGGHLVSGHIDGVGILSQLQKEENATWLTIKASEEILNYVIYKGSIAIDGVSLTVAEVGRDFFKVSIIPHTSQRTHLLHKSIGQAVNLECDMIGKYIAKFVENAAITHEQTKGVSKALLQKYDFL